MRWNEQESLIFYLMLLRQLKEAAERTRPQKKKRNVNGNMDFLRYLVNNPLRCHIMVQLQRTFSVKGVKISTLLIAQ